MTVQACDPIGDSVQARFRLGMDSLILLQSRNLLMIAGEELRNIPGACASGLEIGRDLMDGLLKLLLSREKSGRDRALDSAVQKRKLSLDLSHLLATVEPERSQCDKNQCEDAEYQIHILACYAESYSLPDLRRKGRQPFLENTCPDSHAGLEEQGDVRNIV